MIQILGWSPESDPIDVSTEQVEALERALADSPFREMQIIQDRQPMCMMRGVRIDILSKDAPVPDDASPRVRGAHIFYNWNHSHGYIGPTQYEIIGRAHAVGTVARFAEFFSPRQGPQLVYHSRRTMKITHHMVDFHDTIKASCWNDHIYSIGSGVP